MWWLWQDNNNLCHANNSNDDEKRLRLRRHAMWQLSKVPRFESLWLQHDSLKAQVHSLHSKNHQHLNSNNYYQI